MEGAERDVVPGHFELLLPINTIHNIDKKVVTTKLTELQHDLKARLGRPEELAILNFLGVLSFRIRDYEGAIGHFDAVLSKDPSNLNALANQRVVLEELSRVTHAQSYKEKLKDLLQVGVEAPSVEEIRQSRCLKARCLAEQAYAHACDIHIDRVESRYEQANMLYEDAFELAGGLFEPLERDNWKFCMAKNAHKIFDFLGYKQEFADAVDHLRRAEDLFYEVTQGIPGDLEFKWESWRHLADLIRATVHRREFKSYKFRPELKDYKADPDLCMVEAVKIAPENAKLWVRYANYVYSLKRKNCLSRAMEMLRRSIELDSSENNFYAFSTRAHIRYKHYKYWLAESDRDSSKHPPSVKYVENAKEDFEKALSIRETPWNYSYLAEVHHLLAKHPEYTAKGDEVVRKLLEKATVFFKKATDCQDGGSRHTLHRVEGQFHFDIGEYHKAKCCFLEAIRCEHESSLFCGNFAGLLQVYLHQLRIDPHLRQDMALLEEIVSKLKQAQIKYGKSSMEKHTISKLKPKYRAEIGMLAEFCKSIPEHEEVVPLLISVAQKPPFSLPVSTGGTLEGPWTGKESFQQHCLLPQGASSVAQHRRVPHGAEQGAPAPTRRGDEVAGEEGLGGSRKRSGDNGEGSGMEGSARKKHCTDKVGLP